MISEEDEAKVTCEGGFLGRWRYGELVGVTSEKSDLFEILGSLIDLNGVGSVDKYDAAIDDLRSCVEKVGESFEG